MNKLTKAGIATAAGIALLMGGAGTLAFWNDGAGLGGGTVTAGHLNLTSAGDGAWDEDLDFIVPGDTVTYTETLTLSAVGDNLSFELNADLDDLDTFDAITVTPTFVVTDGTTAQNITPGTAVSLAEGDYTVEVTVVVEFPWGTDAPGNEDEDAQIVLGDIRITATQV